MDKDLQKLISETIAKTFAESPEKLVERGVREIQYDICPHCKKEIYEKHEYTEDGGVTWRHSDCKGMISRPETPLDQVASWLRPYVKEARDQRHNARKALDMEAVTNGFAPEDQTEKTDLPPSGESKYSKQEPEGPMSAVNIEEVESNRSEREERQSVPPRDYAKLMNGAVRFVNTTKNPVEVMVTEFTSVNGASVGKAYIVRINDISNGV